MDKDIYYAVCRVSGHSISSMGETIITSVKDNASLQKYALICVRCGATPPFEAQGTQRKRKAKEAAAPAEPQSEKLDSLD